MPKAHGFCKIEITNCLPAHVIRWQGVRPDVCGPNCWNLALVFSELIPHLRFSAPEELRNLMNEPFCKKLENGVDRLPGDIGVVRTIPQEDYPTGEVHGFIHISENLVYSKNGYVIASLPYLVQARSSMNAGYGLKGVDERCLQNQKHEEFTCQRYTEFYRCKSMEEYLDDNHGQIDSRITKLFDDLNIVECKVSNLLFNFNTISPEMVQLMVNTYQGISHYLLEQLERLDDLNPTEKILMGKLRHQLLSLQQSIKYIREVDSTAPLNQNDLSDVRISLFELDELIGTSIMQLDAGFGR